MSQHMLVVWFLWGVLAYSILYWLPCTSAHEQWQ